MFCLVYYTEIGVLPEENSLCGNNSHWKYWRKKASTVRTNATSISTKSICIEKRRKIFHLRFPKSNPLNLWACLHFRAVWHNYSMLSPVALLGTSNINCLLCGFPEYCYVQWSARVWEHGHTEELPLSLPSGTGEVQMDDLEAVSELLTSSALDSPSAATEICRPASCIDLQRSWETL